MRSHLPEPVLMNVLTAKTNSSSVHQLHGRAQEQQLYGLVPNSWHHLTFQFSGSTQWSSPSVPLNTTLIELASRMTNDSTAAEEETPLADSWPYCRSHQLFRYGEWYSVELHLIQLRKDCVAVSILLEKSHSSTIKPIPLVRCPFCIN